MSWRSPLLIDIDVSKIFRAVTITAPSSKLTIVNVFAAVTEDTVTGRFKFSFGTGLVAVVTAEFLMCTVDPEICAAVMIEQPDVP
jgi:hypothetical protein